MQPKEEVTRAVSTNDMLDTRLIYHRYGHLLLGYLCEVLKDEKLAEQYMVDIFKEIPYHLTELNKPDPCTWTRLQLFARARLAAAPNAVRPVNAVKSTDQQRPNRFTIRMTSEQQTVFYGLYYDRKSIEVLGEELGLDQNRIRQVLKDAFKIMRDEQQQY